METVTFAYLRANLVRTRQVLLAASWEERALLRQHAERETDCFLIPKACWIDQPGGNGHPDWSWPMLLAFIIGHNAKCDT